MFLEPFVTKSLPVASPAPLPTPQPRRSITRLGKSRSPDLQYNFEEQSPQDVAPNASASSLPRADIRHTIRREISGNFPDVADLQSPLSPDVDGQIRSPWSQSTPQLNQFAAIGGNGVNPQLPTVVERQLDVEQAITLLQELKKTATPDELVALHRALLPTREVVPSKPSPSAVQTDAPSMPRIARRRTVMPPGLATRAGLDEDLLRRPEEFSQLQSKNKSVKKQRKASEYSVIPPPTRNLAALDLADDTSSLAGTQIAAPADSAYTHTGIYRHGTLRITNGAATPEPSIMHGVSSDMKAAEDSSCITLGLATNANNPVAQRVATTTSAIQQTPTASSGASDTPAQLSVEQPAARNMLFEGQYVGKTRRQFSSENPYELSIEHRNAKTPHRRIKKSQITEPGTGVPVIWADVPKSRPKLHNGPLHISHGHDVDYGSTSSPIEQNSEKQNRSAGIQQDGGVEKSADLYDMSAPEEARESALLKLDDQAEIPGAPLSNNIAPQRLNVQPNDRPKSTHHPDSGYGSDTLSHDSANKASRGITRPENLQIVTLPGWQSSSTPETILTSPITPKKSSPFALFKSRRKSAPVIEPGPATLPHDTCEGDKSAATLSTALKPERTVKEPRKLQKAIPEAVLKQRKAELEKLKEKSLESALSEDVFERPEHESSSAEGRFYSSTLCNSNAYSELESEPAKAPPMSRARSKSLDREADRRNHGQSHRPLLEAADGSNLPIDEDGNIGSDRLPKRRSGPTWDNFQHQRQYQIQPGSAMPKSDPKINEAIASFVKPNPEEQATTTDPPQLQDRDLIYPDSKHYRPRPHTIHAAMTTVPPNLAISDDDGTKQQESYVQEEFPLGTQRQSHPAFRSQPHAAGTSHNERDFWPAAIQQHPIFTDDDVDTVGTSRPLEHLSHSNESQPRPPKHDFQHVGWPGWERQAKLWRERRQAAGVNLGNLVESTDDPMGQAPVHSTHLPQPTSPADLAPHYYTTTPQQNGYQPGEPTSRPGGNAAQQADAYRHLIMDDTNNRPGKDGVTRTDSAQSTATFHTVQSSHDRTAFTQPDNRPNQLPVSGNIPTSERTHHPTPDYREDGRNHVRNNSGSFVPYRPEDASHAERLRSHTTNPSESRAAHPRSDAPKLANGVQSLLDRYGGGLGFGWDRAVGFRGSAGLGVSVGDAAATSKHRNAKGGMQPQVLKVGQEYGIDLGDVPVFLRKV